MLRTPARGQRPDARLSRFRHRVNRVVGVTTLAVATGRYAILGYIYSLFIVECTVWRRDATLYNDIYSQNVVVCTIWRRVAMRKRLYDSLLTRFDGAVYYVAALHHSWTSATSGLRGLFLITCRQNFLRGLFLVTCRQNFFVCEAPSGARPSAVVDVADA
ncbi:hypothetical protein EVAR_2816_1 [Eumeta japonica]|uniref:Uncharacterized protein n=1 Tax=Eumeta variegata TaxID=151549 RepID=A0A4C1SZT2_EUMVA|nr:hypothetical protein EVAR_2816_1 [Eumeta japonica]